MKDILIRDVPEETHAQLLAKAQVSKEGALGSWLRAQLEILAAGPVVKERYAIRIGGVGQIRRFSDAFTSIVYKGTSQEEADVLVKAKEMIERNSPNDREDAIWLLRNNFDDVYETSI